MKNKIKILLITIGLVLINTISLYAAAPRLSITFYQNPTNKSQITVYINNDSSGNFSLTGTLTVSGVGSGSTRVSLPGAGSDSVTVTAQSSGNLNATFSGVYSEHGVFVDTDTGAQNSFNVNLGGNGGNTTPPVTPPTGNGGNTGGNNNSGNQGTQEPIAETEAERLAREQQEEEERKAEEAKKHLISSIEIKSNSEKKKDQVLKTIEPEADVFEYDYNLPMFIEDILLDVKSVDDSVTIEVEKEHSITEEKEIVIKASKDDISQEIKLKLAPNDKPLIEKEDGFVYLDDNLNEALAKFGYEVKEFEEDGKASSMFTKGELNLQMIMNDEHKIQFYRLDTNGVFQEKGQVLVHGEDLLFVTSEVSEELASKTLYSNGYKEVDLPLPSFLKDVDESLEMNQIAKGWTYDDGLIVNALDSELKSDLYNVASEEETTNIKAAVVAFDKVNNTMFYTLIGVSIALVASLIALIILLINYKKKIVQINR